MHRRVLQVSSDSERFVPRSNDIVVNYGCGRSSPWLSRVARVINNPSAVNVASNKLSTFSSLLEKNVSIPPFTTDVAEAKKWIADGKTVLCRTILNGSEGRGIVIAEKAEELVNAPLYVQYIKKKNEYRVHVLFGNVIDVQEKRRQAGLEDKPDPRIRNHRFGYVFCRNNVSAPDSALSSAIAAVAAVGLDFGAVDVIYNEKQDKSYVLEINTAPGLEGITVDKYGEALIHELFPG